MALKNIPYDLVGKVRLVSLNEGQRGGRSTGARPRLGQKIFVGDFGVNDKKKKKLLLK